MKWCVGSWFRIPGGEGAAGSCKTPDIVASCGAMLGVTGQAAFDKRWLMLFNNVWQDTALHISLSYTYFSSAPPPCRLLPKLRTRNRIPLCTVLFLPLVPQSPLRALTPTKEIPARLRILRGRPLAIPLHGDVSPKPKRNRFHSPRLKLATSGTGETIAPKRLL